MAGKGSLKGFEFGVPSMQGLAHKENYVNMEPPPLLRCLPLFPLERKQNTHFRKGLDKNNTKHEQPKVTKSLCRPQVSLQVLHWASKTEPTDSNIP